MCLYTKMFCPQRAKKDIICYKLFDNPHVEGEIVIWKTPFRRYPMIIGKVYKISSDEPLVSNTRYIRGGFFHAYTTLEEAKYHRLSWMSIIECVIPKGTLYYKSLSGLEICARTIKLEKIIDI